MSGGNRTRHSNYLWLACYDVQPEKHASCIVHTYEPDEDAYGNIYTIRGEPPHCALETMRSMALITQDSDDGHESSLFVSRLLLGLVSDAVLEVLSTYIEEAVAVLNDGNVNEDWTLVVIRSFEDSRFLPAGTLVRAIETLERGPRSRDVEE